MNSGNLDTNNKLEESPILSKELEDMYMTVSSAYFMKLECFRTL